LEPANRATVSHSTLSIERGIATLPTGAEGAKELWKLNDYYERLDDWNASHGIPKNPFAGPAAEPIFELRNLTADPEERHNRVSDDRDALSQLTTVLDTQREAKRLSDTWESRVLGEHAGCPTMSSGSKDPIATPVVALALHAET
jgi:hypothetical protein